VIEGRKAATALFRRGAQPAEVVVEVSQPAVQLAPDEHGHERLDRCAAVLLEGAGHETFDRLGGECGMPAAEPGDYARTTPRTIHDDATTAVRFLLALRLSSISLNVAEVPSNRHLLTE
jgi:hypothetical protein